MMLENHRIICGGRWVAGAWWSKHSLGADISGDKCLTEDLRHPAEQANFMRNHGADVWGNQVDTQKIRFCTSGCWVSLTDESSGGILPYCELKTMPRQQNLWVNFGSDRAPSV